MMRVAVLALIVVVLFPALAFAQANDKDQDKVSNDQPDRPLQMPPATTEVKEALDDFERFSRRNAWERALKALYTISQDQSQRFIDGEKGFIIPVARKRRLVLSALPSAGQAAYRLFYDSDARKLFDEAKGPTELATLERIYSAYFSTSIGDNAADRLGDLYFELGRFDRAADCWLDVLRGRTDTDLSPALLAVKAARRFIRLTGGRNSSRFARTCASGTQARRLRSAARRPLRRRCWSDCSNRPRPLRKRAPRRPGQPNPVSLWPTRLSRCGRCGSETRLKRG